MSDGVDEIASSSGKTAEWLLRQTGFIQVADLNRDRMDDYIFDTSYSGSPFWCNAVDCKSIVYVSTEYGYVRNDLMAASPTPESFICNGSSCRVSEVHMASVKPEFQTFDPDPKPEQESASGDLPLLGAGTAARVSLGNFCDRVNRTTAANGGMATTQSDDANIVMAEQMCLARSYAIEDGKLTLAEVSDGGQAYGDIHVDLQCAQYGPVLKPFIDALAVRRRGEVLREANRFLDSSNMDPVQLARTARICLYSGYRTEEMDIALGSAVLLVALGENPYGELVGHHLSQGYGVMQRVDLSIDWYQDALDAIAAGAQPVFAPFQTDRMALVQYATDLLAGREPVVVQHQQSTTRTTLPVFGLPSNN